MRYQAQFIKVIEANTENLADFVSQGVSFFEAPELFIYTEILLSYFEFKIEKLEALFLVTNRFAKSVNSDVANHLRNLCELRLSIRENMVKNFLIKKTIESIPNELWAGETYMVAGYATNLLDYAEDSCFYYRKAIIEFGKIGAYRKKIKALHNWVAVGSRSNFNNRLIDDYLYVFKEAWKLGIKAYAGLALSNAAREFQILGLLKLAEKFSKRSMALARYEPLTSHYYYIHLNRSHVLIELGRYPEAEVLINLCEQSSFIEIAESSKILRSIINGNPFYKTKFTNRKYILPGWKERLIGRANKTNFIKIGELEEKLIYFVSIKARSKKEIINYLYGAVIDQEFTTARVKTLLWRINKKWKNLIVYKGFKYELEYQNSLSRLIT